MVAIMRKFILVLLVCWFTTAGKPLAQTLNQEMSALADKLSKALVTQGIKNVAAVDFTDLQGQPTELGRFLSERLTGEMASAGRVSMVDRANIKSILAEHKLTEEGLVNPANAKKLGEFAGVDAILTGNVTALDDGIELMVKAISTDSAKIVAAGRITFKKTSDIQQLLNRGISSNPTTNASTTTGAGRDSTTSYQEANAIATKDVGSLRVVLKSVVPTRHRGSNGQTAMGIRCSFEFINRETQRPIVVAMNATPGDGPSYSYGSSGGKCSSPPWVAARIGDLLRTTLVDERGTVWRLSASDVTGMSIVSVGKSSASDVFSPTDIASLLRRQDETGTNMTRDADCPRLNPFAFVFGSTTQILPGQSVTVPMSFAQDAGETPSSFPPKFFQIVSEIVVGVVTTGPKTSYSLHNLTFDRVTLPAGGGR
jgi:TolB-like protein